MIESIKSNIMAKLAAAAALALITLAVPAIANAQAEPQIDNNVKCGSNISGLEGSQCDSDVQGSGSDIENLIRTIINVFSVIVGSISVIMIIIGGFRYITSAGDSNNVGGAKNTILYAIVGLVIVAFAQIIVQFVLQRTVTS
jgi:hypothetical protein